MPVWLHAIAQVIFGAFQILNATGFFTDATAKDKWIAALVTALLQSALAVFNHYHNPDGTSAHIAWVKKS